MTDPIEAPGDHWSRAPRTPDEASVKKALRAVFIAFGVTGFAFASWASRLPDVKVLLGLTAGQLSQVLLVSALGSVLGLPIAGKVVERVGTRRTIEIAATFFGLGLAVAAIGVTVLNVWVVMAGVFVVGTFMGVWDVAMNHEGATVERHLGRAIMPWFHAAFSMMTVVGALIGALMTGLHVPVWAHMLLPLASIAWVVLGGIRGFLPREADEAEEKVEKGRSAWAEPRTLLVGLIVLVAAFTEGTANDWVAIALREGYGLPGWVGVLGFAVFLGTMTLGRVLGTGLLDRYGRVPVLRAMFAVAFVGSLLVVFGGPVLAFVGAALWGVGASLGFPVGMSAASDEPSRAAARLSVVATIATSPSSVARPWWASWATTWAC